MPVGPSDEQRRALRQMAAMPIIAGLTVCVLLLCWVATCELPLIGPGPRSWLFAIPLAVIHFLWLKDRFDSFETPERPLCEGAASVALLPLGLLGGRILFSVFPPFDDWAGGFIGLILTAMLMRFLFASGNFEQFTYVRGTKLFTRSAFEAVVRQLSEAESERRNAPACTTQQSLTVEWAGQPVPIRSMAGNCMTIGRPGSGKTLQHRAVLRSLIKQLRPESDCRVVVYDLKMDFVSECLSWNAHVPVHLMNPLDSRSFSWNLAADFTNPNQSQDLARCFIPDRGDGRGDRENLFFRSASQTILSAALQALMIHAPGAWTLRDVVHLMSDKRLLRRLLLAVPQTAPVVGARFVPRRTFQDIQQTCQNSIDPLRVAASIYDTNPNQLSLRSWMNSGSSVLVMGTAFDYRTTTAAVNRAMFRYIAFAALSGAESLERPKLTFHCDELQEAQYLDGLTSLLADGRSKGCFAFLGCQDLEGMRLSFGDAEGVGIVNRCANTSILSLSSQETAEWASKRIGETERREYLRSGIKLISRHRNDPNATVGESLVSRPAVLPSELLHLLPVERGRVPGFHVLPMLGGVLKDVVEYPLHDHDPRANYQQRPDIEQLVLRPWCDADLRRLRLDANDQNQARVVNTPREPQERVAAEHAYSEEDGTRAGRDWLYTMMREEF